MPVLNFQQLTNADKTTTRTLLHEAIPITGTILTGAYSAGANIKNYTHGQFQSVYDYPYLSSSANHIFDISVGYDESSGCSASAVAGTGVQIDKKINMYNQFAQTYLGFTGSSNTVELFESDLSFVDNNAQMKQCFFVNFSRLLTKDQIKKGSVSLTVSSASWGDGTPGDTVFDTDLITLTDASASEGTNAGVKNTLAGDYGVLYTSGNVAHGLVFYQAGTLVLSSSLFASSSNAVTDASVAAGGPNTFNSGSVLSGSSTNYTPLTVVQSLVSASISGSCDALRHRIKTLSFNNTTEINSQIYFCRVPHNKFNYSSNPTYLSGSKIRVKTSAADQPVSYITTVGLYNSAGELLATAKLSEPLRKDPNNEITLRVRLDY